MPKLISELVEGKILALAAEGIAYRAILKRLKAENINLTIGTISNVINRKGKKRLASDSGEKFELDRVRIKRTPAMVSTIKNMCQRKSVPTQESMAKVLGCSIATVNQVIHEDLALKTRKKAKGHRLNERQIANRKTNVRKLSRSYVNSKHYEFLVTIDESWLYLDDCNKTNPICYVKNREDIENQDIITTHELGGKKIMCIGILTGRGPIPLQFVKQNVKINSSYYCEQVLGPLVKKWLPTLYPEGLEKVFVHHDAAPSHISGATLAFMNELTIQYGITFIRKEDIPVKSPDASPLDFFGFGYLKQKLKQRRVRTLAGLRKAASSVWLQIDREMVLRCFESWHKRLLMIEYKHGNHIEHTKRIHRKRLGEIN